MLPFGIKIIFEINTNSTSEERASMLLPFQILPNWQFMEVQNKEGKHVKDSRKNEEKKTKTMEGK